MRIVCICHASSNNNNNNIRYAIIKKESEKNIKYAIKFYVELYLGELVETRENRMVCNVNGAYLPFVGI